MPDGTPVLQVQNVSKRFGGVEALLDVSIEFEAGRVHALLGENGAGKSTLVKIISRVQSADEGRIVYGDDSTTSVALVFQELSLLPQLSIEDNMLLGLRQRRGRVNRRRFRDSILQALSRAGLQGLDPRLPISALPLAQRQLLEIARGLITNPKILILDEPTATLSDVEITRIHDVIRGLRRDGHAIVYITHRLHEVFRLADDITVMRNGRIVANGPVSSFTMDKLYSDMLGDQNVASSERDYHSALAEVSQGPVICLTDASSQLQFSNISLTVLPGEIVALLGQVGAGADALAGALVGLVPIHSGTVEVMGRRLTRINRVSTQRAGIGYVSADRVKEGVFLDASVAKNVSSGALDRIINHLGLISARRERHLASEYASAVSLSADRIQATVLTLSGGNQQKVSIARALAAMPQVLVLSEPTRGVDVGARAEIYRSLRKLTENGLAIVVYTSDLDEVFDLADRVITMFRGRMISAHSVENCDETTLLREILHGGVIA
jgi:ribose transport system ATP-binding protein